MRYAPDLRDRATRRVRRLTTALVAGATLLTAAFAGLAAGSTHSAKRTVQRPARTTTTAGTVTAPTPTLVQSGTATTPSTQSGTQSQTQSQTPSVTPSTSPPVATSGGS
jgi:hypothetical protein